MSRNNFFGSVVKGLLISISAALAGTALFALIVKLTGLPSNVVKAVNQFIKIISVFCGCFFAFGDSKGALKGAILGVSFTVCIHLLFLILGGELSLKGFWLELAFGLISGTILGILTVNVKAGKR